MNEIDRKIKRRSENCFVCMFSVLNNLIFHFETVSIWEWFYLWWNWIFKSKWNKTVKHAFFEADAKPDLSFLCEGEKMGRTGRVQIGNIHDTHNFTYMLFSVMHAALVKYPVDEILFVLQLWEFCHEFERIHVFTLNLYVLKKHFCIY